MIISKITEPLKEICCGAWSSYALTIDGSLYSWGANDQG
jgi:alpha-tubulin suppressor-like RCC1 family protein